MSALRYQPLSGTSRTSLKQISNATWPAALGVASSIPFILAICLTTDDRQTASSLWTSNAAVLVAVGGIILKGSLGALIGIALYHRLWLLLGREGVRKNGQVVQGLPVKEIESHHLASRLGVGMLFEPSASLAWACGVAGLLLTAAIVPALQYGVDVVSRSSLSPRNITLQHAQLDHRMALTSGASGSADGVSPNVLRAASVALFGADNAFVYTIENVTGVARFVDVQYADVDCNIDSALGQVQSSADYRYYNFSYNFIATNGAATYDYNYYEGLQFQSTINNDTHFVHHDCQIRPAIGICSVRLNAGTGLMRDLHCKRSSWLTDAQLPNTVESPAMRFYAVVTAFVVLFQGEAWISGTQSRPQQNSTFIAATARYFDRSTIGMPLDLISHVQRTLWHTAINARPVNLPPDEVGGAYDLNGTVGMAVQDETPVLLVKINFVVIYVVLGLALVTALASLVYLFMATNHVPGTLMRDSMIHTFAVGARSRDRSATVSAIYLPHAQDQSLEQILKAGGRTRLRCVLLRDLHAADSQRRLVIEQERQEGVPLQTEVIHLQPSKDAPEISREPSPRPRLPSSRETYQRATPSISPEPSIYFHEPSDFQEVSRQYRIYSLPVAGPRFQQQERSSYHDYYEPPTRLCDCRNPEHHHSLHH